MPVVHHALAVSPILVGRASEVEALHEFVERARNGQGQTVFISGEPGIGKSRLVAEAVAQAVAKGFLQIQGACFQADFARPFAPFHDLLRNSTSPGHQDQLSHFAQERTLLLSEVASAITTDAARPVSEQHKYQLFDRLNQYFIRLAAHQPLALLIEDIHWGDETSLEFLYHLARQSTNRPIILFLTFRSDEISASLRSWLAEFGRNHLAQEILLERLPYNEVSTMLRAIFAADQAISPEFVGAIHTLTEGNPFFIEEVLKSLITTGELYYRDGKWNRKPIHELRIPRSIHDAVQRRFEHLDSTARHVLSLAAVIGRRFDFDLLLHLTQLDETQLVDIMKDLIGNQLVVEEAQNLFAFRHALTRQAIYSGLLARERKKLHHKIVQAIEDRSHSADISVAELAYHAFEAEDWTKALDYSVTAGEQAESFYAPHMAIQHFARAEQAAQRMATTLPITLYRARGLAYEATGEIHLARKDLEKALDLAQSTEDRKTEWQLLLDLGMLWAGQDYARTGEYYRQAFEFARLINDPKALGHSLNRIGNWHLNVGRPVDAHWYHQEALKIFEESSDRPGIAETLDLLGMASYLGGNAIQGTEYYQRAVPTFRELDDRRGLVSSLATLTMSGPTYQTDTLIAASSLAAAANDGEAALQIAREIGQRADEAYSMIFLSICLGSQGDYQRAIPLAQEALAIAKEIEHRQWITAANFALGALYLDIFAVDLAQVHLEQALSLARDGGSLHWEQSSAGLLTLVYVAGHQLDRAKALLDELNLPAAPISTLGQRLLGRAQVECALDQGDASTAMQALDGLYDALNRTAVRGHSIRLLKLRAEALMLLNQYDEAETSLLTAQEIASDLGVRPLQWRLHLLLARLHASQKHYAQADTSLKQANNLVEQLAANILEPSLQTGFKQKAIARTNQLSKIEFGGLTQREREIAVLIAQGKSNRLIAQDLVVGERTVETHVGNILSKLGFTSRSQVAAWVVEQNLPDRTI